MGIRKEGAITRRIIATEPDYRTSFSFSPSHTPSACRLFCPTTKCAYHKRSFSLPLDLPQFPTLPSHDICSYLLFINLSAIIFPTSPFQWCNCDEPLLPTYGCEPAIADGPEALYFPVPSIQFVGGQAFFRVAPLPDPHLCRWLDGGARARFSAISSLS